MAASHVQGTAPPAAPGARSRTRFRIAALAVAAVGSVAVNWVYGDPAHPTPEVCAWILVCFFAAVIQSRFVARRGRDYALRRLRREGVTVFLFRFAWALVKAVTAVAVVCPTLLVAFAFLATWASVASGRPFAVAASALLAASVPLAAVSLVALRPLVRGLGDSLATGQARFPPRVRLLLLACRGYLWASGLVLHALHTALAVVNPKRGVWRLAARLATIVVLLIFCVLFGAIAFGIPGYLATHGALETYARNGIDLDLVGIGIAVALVVGTDLLSWLRNHIRSLPGDVSLLLAEVVAYVVFSTVTEMSPGDLDPTMRSPAVAILHGVVLGISFSLLIDLLQAAVSGMLAILHDILASAGQYRGPRAAPLVSAAPVPAGRSRTGTGPGQPVREVPPESTPAP